MFKRIYFFFLTYLVVVTYNQTLLLLWFAKNGLSYKGMLLHYFLMFLLSLCIFFILQGRTIGSRSAFFIGIVASALGVYVASIMTHSWSAYIVSLFFGVSGVFFWTTYNALYFKYSNKDEHGFKSGLYFLLSPICAAILAPVAGIVAEKLGYHFLFLSSLFLYLIPLALIFYLPSFIFKFEAKRALAKLENRTLVFFQGYNSILSFTFIPIFTLFFISNPLQLGSFFGYLALLGAITALFNSKLSDKLKKRAPFFYFFTILDSISYLPLAFVKSLVLWQVFAGVNHVTVTLENPFGFALVLDHTELNETETMLGREIYLIFGRLALLAISFLVLWLTNSFKVVLIVASIGTLLYPLVAYYRKVYLKK